MWGESTAASQAQQQLERKCKAFRAGLESCKRANSAEHCKNLEMRLVTCLAESACKEEAEAHKKCYTSLYKVRTVNTFVHTLVPSPHIANIEWPVL